MTSDDAHRAPLVPRRRRAGRRGRRGGRPGGAVGGGRFVGYWRLTGPFGRRKFGQRVWCHIQVVDPHGPPAPPTEREIKNAMAIGTDDDDDDDMTDGGAADGAAAVVHPDGTAAPSMG